MGHSVDALALMVERSPPLPPGLWWIGFRRGGGRWDSSVALPASLGSARKGGAFAVRVRYSRRSQSESLAAAADVAGSRPEGQRRCDAVVTGSALAASAFR
jgi:hypothetical protein